MGGGGGDPYHGGGGGGGWQHGTRHHIYIYIFYITPRIFPKIRWVTEASYNPTSRGYNFRTDPAAHQNTEVRGQTPGAMRMNHLSSG